MRRSSSPRHGRGPGRLGRDGCPGWSYREVLPYFKRSEANERLAGEFHGIEGPLGVSDQRHTPPLSKAFVQACQDYGMPHNADFNGREQRRRRALSGHQPEWPTLPARPSPISVPARRPNLSVRTGRSCTSHSWSRTAALPAWSTRPAKSCFTVRAQREVVLAAGRDSTRQAADAVGHRSGPAPGSHGIKPAADLPSVGRNLHDHLDIFMMYNGRPWRATTLTSGSPSSDLGRSPICPVRSGPVSATVVEGGAFWTTAGRSASPDLQFHFLAGTGIEAVTGDMSTGTAAPSMPMCSIRARAASSR